jgi:molecular chaperone GrpE
VTDPHVEQGEEPTVGTEGSFPDSAAEMANETEVEADVPLEVLADARVAELTNDLQRLQAEYLNYKRRVDRDRDLVKENATYAALAPITEVMDTIDRAREHGEVEGGFKAVADQLERVLAGRGLVKFGEVGDPFDPTVHEALSHIGEDPEVAVTTCKVIAKAGYRIGDRVVRAAQVLVVDPASGPTEDVGGGTIDPGAESPGEQSGPTATPETEPEVRDDGE